MAHETLSWSVSCPESCAGDAAPGALGAAGALGKSIAERGGEASALAPAAGASVSPSRFCAAASCSVASRSPRSEPPDGRRTAPADTPASGGAAGGAADGAAGGAAGGAPRLAGASAPALEGATASWGALGAWCGCGTSASAPARWA